MFANDLKKFMIGLSLTIGALLPIFHPENAHGVEPLIFPRNPGSVDPSCSCTTSYGIVDYAACRTLKIGYVVTHSQMGNGNTTTDVWPLFHYSSFLQQSRSAARLLPGPRRVPGFPEISRGGWDIMGAHGRYSEAFYDRTFGLIEQPEQPKGCNRRLLAFSCNAETRLQVSDPLEVVEMSPLEVVARKNPGRFVYGLSPNAINHTLDGPFLSKETGEFVVHVNVVQGYGGGPMAWDTVENPIAVGIYKEGKFRSKDLNWSACQEWVEKRCGGNGDSVKLTRNGDFASLDQKNSSFASEPKLLLSPTPTKTCYFDPKAIAAQGAVGGLNGIIRYYQQSQWEERAKKGDDIAIKYLRSQEEMAKLQLGIGLENQPWWYRIIVQGGAYMHNGGLDNLR